MLVILIILIGISVILITFSLDNLEKRLKKIEKGDK